MELVNFFASVLTCTNFNFVSIKNRNIHSQFFDGVLLFFYLYCKKGFSVFCGYLKNCFLHCVSFVAWNTKMRFQYLALFFRKQIYQFGSLLGSTFKGMGEGVAA